ncbi:hypothetical protein HDE69_004288 [Pedobacter cryoconitis]|uniref:SMEK domain-containing protein n=1 Tax=Pedobacter cryoconitis TaxID=188932 RepID=A0A7W8YX80_9SPHI|nr:ABC-three component system protein [Pedobacter cryoconitis]MBB5623205.1 hypothetical protein [Pedobacter cryoconitis]
MNRSVYYNYIDEKLNLLSLRTERRGKINILDFHLHSENFYLHFFNKLYDWKLENLNAVQQNVEAIDLIDHTSKFIFQVSATNTKAKVESTLSKDILSKYPGYSFKFISIAKDASDLRAKIFSNPHNLIFNPALDIFDVNAILNYVLGLDIVKQKEIYEFIKLELGQEVDIVKLDSNLAAIINILSKEDWNDLSQLDQINSFEIERKITFNNLARAKFIIDDYKIHYGRVDSKYAQFDSFGKNKSNAVLSSIRKEYIQQKGVINDDELFFAVIEKVILKIQQSANYEEIPIDELELSVNILVVDAFIRCKIFENPENYNYATA